MFFSFAMFCFSLITAVVLLVYSVLWNNVLCRLVMTADPVLVLVTSPEIVLLSPLVHDRVVK